MAKKSSSKTSSKPATKPATTKSGEKVSESAPAIRTGKVNIQPETEEGQNTEGTAQ